MSNEQKITKKEMSSEEFLEFLRRQVMNKKRIIGTKKPKPIGKLTKKEEDTIATLYDTNSLEEACEILKPLYQEHKKKLGKEQMPVLILSGIYFIIVRECVWNLNELSKKKSIDVNVLLRKPLKKIGRTEDVYVALGEKSSKLQERFGIRPFWDFAMLSFIPVEFNSIEFRGELTRTIILSILLHYDYPSFVDLSGDISIFEDIYFGRNEVLNCTDSIVANFYQTLKLRYKDFEKYFILRLSKLPCDSGKLLEACEKQLQENRKKPDGSIEVTYLTTYPKSFEEINLELAFDYLLVKLLKTGESIDQIKERYSEKLPENVFWLKERINSTVIVWETMEHILENVLENPVGYRCLTPNGMEWKQITRLYLDDIEQTIDKNLKEKLKELRLLGEKADDVSAMKHYHSNKDKARLKKGVIFYDYDVQKDIMSAMAFRKFISKKTCFWIFVCDRADSSLADEIKKYGKVVIRLSDTFALLQKYLPSVKDKIIITNIKFNNLLYDNILSSIGKTFIETVYESQVGESNYMEVLFDIEYQ